MSGLSSADKFRRSQPLRWQRARTIVRPAFRRAPAWRRLGRSQVVRQRILIPPYGGSNPPAPATHSRNSEIRHARRSAPHSAGLCGRGDWRPTKLGDSWRFCARRLQCRFSNLRNCQWDRRDWLLFHETGLHPIDDGPVKSARKADATRARSRRSLLCWVGGEPDQPRPNCSSCSAQVSGRLRASR